jgi:hypothetical protein
MSGLEDGRRVRRREDVSDLLCLRKLGFTRRVLGKATFLRKFRKSDTSPTSPARCSSLLCFAPVVYDRSRRVHHLRKSSALSSMGVP